MRKKIHHAQKQGRGVRVKGKMDTAKYRKVLEENLLQSA